MFVCALLLIIWWADIFCYIFYGHIYDHGNPITRWWIRRGKPIPWPVRSSEVTHMDCYVWGHKRSLAWDVGMQRRTDSVASEKARPDHHGLLCLASYVKPRIRRGPCPKFWRVHATNNKCDKTIKGLIATVFSFSVN